MREMTDVSTRAFFGRVWIRLVGPSFAVEQSILPERTHMGILKAFGLGLTIVILKLLLPDVMNGFEGTLSAFFRVTETILLRLGSSLAQ